MNKNESAPGRSWSVWDWRRGAGGRCRARGLRASAERRKVAAPSSRLRIKTSSSAPHCRAEAAAGAADVCGTFLQSSSRTAPSPRAKPKSKDEPEKIKKTKTKKQSVTSAM